MTITKLTTALQQAAEAHHEYERTLGHPDGDWAGWYAAWIINRYGPLETPTEAAE